MASKTTDNPNGHAQTNGTAPRSSRGKAVAEVPSVFKTANGATGAAPAKRGRLGDLKEDEIKKARRRSSLGVVAQNEIPQPPRELLAQLARPEH